MHVFPNPVTYMYNQCDTGMKLIQASFINWAYVYGTVKHDYSYFSFLNYRLDCADS